MLLHSLLQDGGDFQRIVPENERCGESRSAGVAAPRASARGVWRGITPSGARLRIRSSRERSSRVADSSRKRSELWLGTLAWAVLAACSAAPPSGNLQYIEPDTYRVENPSADRALVTGIGCAPTANEAEERAREVSTFNLRRVTGNARYQIEYSRLRETSQSDRVCVEVQAQAIPLRLD